MAIKNTDQLRDLLSGVLEKVIEGTISPTQANAVSNLTGKFMQTVQLDMKYHQMKDSMPNMKFLSSDEEVTTKLDHDKNTGEIKYPNGSDPMNNKEAITTNEFSQKY